MTWFKVDDAFSTHPKVDALGRDQALAVAAWTLCGAACARDLTDGFVSHPALLRTLAAWSAGDRARASAALCRVGLWHPVDGGFRFHDWATYQPSRADVDAEREAWKERQRRSRGRRQHVTPTVSHDHVTRDKPVSHGVPIPSRSRPDPDPCVSESAPASPATHTRPEPIPTIGPLAEAFRVAVVEHYQARKLPPPPETRVLTSPVWSGLARWLWDAARARGYDSASLPDRARVIVQAFYASDDPRTKAAGYDLAFLAKRPGQYIGLEGA